MCGTSQKIFSAYSKPNSWVRKAKFRTLQRVSFRIELPASMKAQLKLAGPAQQAPENENDIKGRFTFQNPP